MTAGDRTALYRFDVPARGDGLASNVITRAVLRELCRVAHDAGIASVFLAVVAERVGVSEKQAKRALARLLRDGWIQRPVRGVGNRVGTGPRASVYVIRTLPDADERLWPDPEWVTARWAEYVVTPRFLALSPANRLAVRTSRQATLGPLDGFNKGTALSQQGDSPVPHTQGHEQEEVPARVHPRVAARARGRLALIAAKEPRP